MDEQRFSGADADVVEAPTASLPGESAAPAGTVGGQARPALDREERHEHRQADGDVPHVRRGALALGRDDVEQQSAEDGERGERGLRGRSVARVDEVRGERTRVTADTTEVLYIVYAPPGVGRALVERHLYDIQRYALLVAPDADTELLTTYP